jgi:malate dehydrogenase (oxaloacetate-decarboxylating)(NADP+)
VQNRAERLKIDTSGMEIVEIKEDERFERYVQALWSKRQRKGMNATAARAALRRNITYAAMMVAEGDADGLVGGLTSSYADTLKPALQAIGRAPGAPVVSGVYVMLFKGRRLFFGDCTVNREPSAEQLAHIAMNTARVAQSFGYTPRVAMLSYSDFGEQKDDEEVRRVREAVGRVRQAWPGLVIDGEMQADTAVNPELVAGDFPFSAIQGDANVLVFPSLAAGNIAYKLLRELGGATAVGPILVGLARPVNVLALGSSVSDIVNMAAITVNQVLDREARRA